MFSALLPLHLASVRFAFHSNALQPSAFDRRAGFHDMFKDLGKVLSRNPDDRLLFKLESRLHARRVIYEWDEKSIIANGRLCRRSP